MTMIMCIHTNALLKQNQEKRPGILIQIVVSQEVYDQILLYTFAMKLFISNGKCDASRCILHVGTDWTNKVSCDKVVYPPCITIKIPFFCNAHRCTILLNVNKMLHQTCLKSTYMGGWSPTSVPLVGLVYPFFSRSSQYWPLDKKRGSIR